LDRLGIMRPTKNVPVGKLNPTITRTTVPIEENPELPCKDYPEWKTQSLWLHWDLNPWSWSGTSEGIDYSFTSFITENNGSRNDGNRKLQGLLTLVDSHVGDGGFCCVPGFHKHLSTWASKTSNTAYAERYHEKFIFVHVPKADLINQQVKHVSARAGSLLVWNSELPHCNYPNDSNNFRINQYVKMFPAQEGRENTEIRQDIMKELTTNVEVTNLGKKILGLENWEQD